MRLLPFAALAATVILTSCKKESAAGVPLVPVDITVNINFPEYTDLQAPGGWVYMTGGSLGLIVYRKNMDEFTALDRHCPFQPENLCRVVVDESQVIARDTACCHSAFLLLDGSPTEGPSSFSLKSYHTIFNGSTLRIYN